MRGRDIETKFAEVKFFMGGLYYKVLERDIKELISKKGNLKNCLIVNIRTEEIITFKEFIKNNPEKTVRELVYVELKHIQYKVYKKIKGHK